MKKRWESYIAIQQQYPQYFVDYPIASYEYSYEIAKQYEQEHHIKLGVLHQSDYHVLVVDLIKNADGSYFTYERILTLSSCNASVVVPTFRDTFVLIQQLRFGSSRMDIAFPRGFGEDGLQSAENARKECMEEIGATTEKQTYLGSLYPDNGLTNTKVDVYHHEVGQPSCPSQHEGIVALVYLTKQEIKEYIVAQKICDAFTIAAFYLYLENDKKA